MKEKEEDKAEYNEVVTKGETAGLLEQSTPDVFRTSLGSRRYCQGRGGIYRGAQA